MTHTLIQEQELGLSLEEAWEFFSSPHNLSKITPDDLGFEIKQTNGDRIYRGQIITYKIKLLPLLSLDWVTEITEVIPLKCFIDDQRIGPYALWHHRHEFTPTDSGVLMKDTVHYALPLGWAGNLAHPLFVRNKLHSIFTHRKKIIAEQFPPRH